MKRYHISRQNLRGMRVFFDCHNTLYIEKWTEVWKRGATFFAAPGAYHELLSFGMTAEIGFPQGLPDVAVIILPDIDRKNLHLFDVEQEVYLVRPLEKIATICTMFAHGKIIVSKIDTYEGVVQLLCDGEVFPWQTRDYLLCEVSEKVERYHAALADWVFEKSRAVNRRPLFEEVERPPETSGPEDDE
jgi:hypothetical protein